MEMSLVAKVKGPGPSGFGYGSTAEEVTEGIDLSKKNIFVTGVTSGLGLETARVLMMRGATVWGSGRTVDKVEENCGHLRGELRPLACDLEDLDSVRCCAEQLHKEAPALDAIIANAGVMALPKLELIQGIEKQFFVNHIAHFKLITGLLDHLASAARVVVLSSGAHHQAPAVGIEFSNLDGSKGYRPWRAYGQSKLANLLFAKSLATRFRGTEKTANAVHPGVIATNLGRHLPKGAELGYRVLGPLFLKTIPQGAATQCYVATHPRVRGISGSYLADCNEKVPSNQGRDMTLAEELWDKSVQIVSE